ncbi:MAG: GGDEF domain-containing protein [Pseudomonadota bacterium]
MLGFLVVIPLQYHQKMRSQDLTVRARKMEVAATTDPLTGLYNRRYFEQALREYLIEFNSINAPLAVLVFDLDHFKAVNDNHGHDAGDLVLKEVSSQLRQLSREHDVVARIGGEEFAIVAPFASDKQVVPFAKRYCKSIAKLRVHLDEATIRPTVSIGVAITTEGTSNVNELMKKADERLYEAKRNGRNRVAA